MDGALEIFLQYADVFGGDARDENLLSVFEQFGRDLDDLFRRLAGTKNDFGKIFSQRAMRVHLRETEVGDRSGLEGAQDFFLRDFSGAKLFEQLGGLGRCHRRKLHHEMRTVTREFGQLSGLNFCNHSAFFSRCATRYRLIPACA